MEENAGSLAKKNHKIWIILGCVLAALLVLYAALCVYATTVMGDKIYPNTYFGYHADNLYGGTDCGGLTCTEAAEKLRAQFDLQRRENLRFTLADGTVITELPLGDIDIAPDFDTTVARLYFMRRSENVLLSGAKYLTALVQPMGYIDCSFDEAFAPAAQEVLAALERDAVNFSWSFDGEALTITKPRDGRTVGNREAIYGQIISRIRSATFGNAMADAMLLDGVNENGAYKAVEVIPASGGDLAAVRRELVAEKVNAAYDIEHQCVTPSRLGVRFTLDDLTAAYDAAEAGETFRFAVEVTQPEVTTEDLEQNLFRDVLSTYTTHADGAVGRRANVKLTAELCTDTILNSGDTFDYQEKIGDITAARGFQPAPGYLNGKTVDMIGGGACQASSTIYAAALYANLEIVTRTAHGFASSYIGLGLDATVASGGPQFIFRNNTLYPIKLVATYDEKNNITIQILGTKTDDSYVKIVSEVLSTTPFTEEIVETDELAPGERKVEQTPYTGYRVKTYRNVYAGDGTLLSSTFEANSNYRARNRIILVGKEPAAETVAPVTPEAPAAETVPALTPLDPPVYELPVEPQPTPEAA